MFIPLPKDFKFNELTIIWILLLILVLRGC